MKKLVSAFILATLLFTACKKEEATESATVEEVATDTTTTAATDGLVSPTNTSQEQTQPVVNGAASGSVLPSQPTFSTTTSATTAKGMNPPHGQAGHHCDISVGAPLNSPPGKKPTTTGATTQSTMVTPATLNQDGKLKPTTNVPTSIASPVVTAPGMNPPHGQEGHLCSVAVGAPLPK